MIKKYSMLKKIAKGLPPASFDLMEELGVKPEATQRGTTSYLIFEALVEKWVEKLRIESKFFVIPSFV